MADERPERGRHCLDRVTGIEPALPAWESLGEGSGAGVVLVWLVSGVRWCLGEWTDGIARGQHVVCAAAGVACGESLASSSPKPTR
jgi:hypothetical protein